MSAPEHQNTQPEPASKNRLRLWLRLLKTTRIIEARLRENLRLQFATTLPRFDVLAALARYDKGLKMSHLSDVLRVSNGNVTGIVDRLLKDGLVVRVPIKGDRRALLVRLTGKGSEEFKVQAEAHESWVNDMLGEISATETSEFSDRLDLMLRSLEKKV